ncbi:MAG TPA: hypothetical protein VMB71_13170 [Acetobacteraceae bacterium]|nr:hypothetical protein [Acetobacteraceae bacterium]
MTVRAHDQAVSLEGECGLADVEPLLGHLRAARPAPLDLSRATHLHAALWQVLLQYRPEIQRPAEEPFLKAWLMPLLTDGAAAGPR